LFHDSNVARKLHAEGMKTEMIPMNVQGPNTVGDILEVMALSEGCEPFGVISNTSNKTGMSLQMA